MSKQACSTTVLLALLAALTFHPPILHADTTLSSLLDPELIARLDREGELRSSLYRGAPPVLIPNVSAAGRIQEELRGLDLSIGTEVLTIYRSDTAEFGSEESRLKIYNILRSISTMQGIQYYSASRRKMRTLFARSYAVADPDSRRPIPDPLVSSIPADSNLYLLQEDLTFGENLYRSEYRYTGEYFLLTNTNLTTMRYLLLPMVRPGASITYILLVPLGKEILFYGATGAHSLRLFGLERRKEDSFYNRLKAIYGWFTGRVEELF